MKSKQRDRARFGVFELDLTAGELHKNGDVVVLQEQPFRVLRMLVEHAGDVVTRDEIKQKLWPNDTVVEFDHGINTAIKKLRQLLGDSAENPQYIQTVARRGYRLVISVEWLGDVDSSSSGDSGPVRREVGGDPAYRVSLNGTRVSHYRVMELVGGGGMGVVYRAEDLKLGRRVALKFLPEELVDDRLALGRFEREARAASALEHPNICPIYEFGEHDGQPFLAMQLLEGQTLRERLASSRVGEDELLHVAISICDGLDAAHRKGIIHRDIKPANIFITDQGEVKILDFGLAKLSELGEPVEVVSEDVKDPGSDWPISLTLTRTGVAVGTAHYMSPEQVRGEKLDARTDLFSFGLVLYEMATGQRAFSGNTAAVVHDAILNRPPIPVRELNSAVPHKLEEVIEKALQKDRELRYRSAAEMRTDLTRLQPDAAGKRRRIVRLAAVATLALASVAGGALWMAQRRLSTQAPSSSLPQFKQRQLTTNSSDNRVTDASISPDGEQLAFVDQKGGIHVKVISTGAVQALATPLLPGNTDVQWGLGPWFHDNKRLIVVANVLGQRPSSWLYPSIGEIPYRISDDAAVSDVSSDDSSLAFTRGPGKTGRDREYWIMGADGKGARKLFELDEDSYDMGGWGWSHNGTRLSYQVFHEASTQGEETLESRDFVGGPPVVLLSTVPWWQKDGLRGSIDLPHGRTVYILGENDINGYRCDLWEIWTDEQTGKPISKPRQLTNWAGFCVQSLTASADGKRLEFLRFTGQRSVQVANLEGGGTRIGNSRRLTESESNEYPTGWTADSKAVIFHSNRNGVWGIFKQSLDQETPEAIVLAAEESGPSSSTPAPDGETLIYTLSPKEQGGSSSPAIAVMRVPITGGAPQLLITAHLIGPPLCTRAPANLCVIAERMDRSQMIFTALDPHKGRGSEIARFATDPNEMYSWALAPDGKSIAVVRHPSRQIEVLSLPSRAKRTIDIRDWQVGFYDPHLASEEPGGGLEFEWAADGNGFFIPGRASKRSAILYVDLRGNAHVLRELNSWRGASKGVFRGPWAVPSPDGRHLAIMNRISNQNAWMMENF